MAGFLGMPQSGGWRVVFHFDSASAALRQVKVRALLARRQARMDRDVQEGSGDAVDCVVCAEHPGRYFAKVVHKAMKGLGTDDSTLLRVIVSRAEIDLQYIKAEYQNKYGKSLGDAVRSETSGNYRDLLLALIGPSH
ncbi:uncharacterized protein LOC133733405 [Rosa rugosa]|uniref:uncharacterized protein LOC133733405 n=1 Tax=Rosa rugosa TaxID=74645 RepID=UPI002B413E16|nr:uncharacterized protein LOC133733405 [Rosa rugosa]